MFSPGCLEVKAYRWRREGSLRTGIYLEIESDLPFGGVPILYMDGLRQVKMDRRGRWCTSISLFGTRGYSCFAGPKKKKEIESWTDANDSWNGIVTLRLDLPLVQISASGGGVDSRDKRFGFEWWSPSSPAGPPWFDIKILCQIKSIAWGQASFPGPPVGRAGIRVG